jgi:hypothetical protein
MVLAACVGLALLLAGCDSGAPADAGGTGKTASPSPTATTAARPTATMAPRPVAAFTCAPGSLPVAAGATQASCQVSEQGGAQVLMAKYTGATRVDETQMTAAGWVHLDSAHGDGAVTSAGMDLFVNQNAWLVTSWTASSDGSSSVTITASIPDGAAKPISCGQTLSAGTTSKSSVPMPADSFTAGQSSYMLVAACEADIQQWYTSHLAAAGWRIAQSFAPPPGSLGAIGTIMEATITNGNTNLTLWLHSDEGTFTEIAVLPGV